MAEDSRYPKLYATRPGAEEPAGPRLDPSAGPAASEPPRDAVGTMLRRTREDYGQDLRQVSEALRIRYAYLDAIERSAFEELPGPTYAIGFVRGYAQYLGLDDDEVVRRFKEESQGLKRDPELHFPAPVNEGKLPGGRILLVSVVLIAGAYGAWTYLSDDTRSVADLVPAVPERLQELVGTQEPEIDGETPQVAATDSPARDGDPAATADPDAGGGRDSDTTSGTSPDGSSTPAVSAGSQDTAADPGSTQPTDPDSGADTGAATASAPDAPAVPDAAGDVPEVPDGDTGTGGQTARTVDEAPETDPALPEAQAATEPAGGADRTDASAEGAAEGADSAAGQNDSEPPAVPELAQDDSGIPTAPGQDQTASRQPEGRSFGADAANSRVTLRATAKSWVQVRGADDSLVLTRMLRPGDVYRVPDRPGLTLHTGNAGGLEVLVDGTSLGDLGEDGQVRRGILLEPGALSGS